MKWNQSYSGKVYALQRDNVDTDQIIPKQFLKRIERKGFGRYLFYNWRFDDGGKRREDFDLDHATNQGVSILLAGKNFGCGSSREHAPWALQDFGFQAVIAPSFADIFYNNCLKNGILPLSLEEEKIRTLVDHAKDGEYSVTISLQDEILQDSKGFVSSFSIDPYWKGMLLGGLDEIDLTLAHEEKIDQYEKIQVR